MELSFNDSGAARYKNGRIYLVQIRSDNTSVFAPQCGELEQIPSNRAALERRHRPFKVIG
jgi:hypothetical protein